MIKDYMEIQIGQTYFTNRTFPYKCSYKSIIDAFIKVSMEKMSRSTSFYADEIIDKFFMHHEFTFTKKVCKYRKGSTQLKQLYDSDFSVFPLEYSKIRENFESLDFNEISYLFLNKGVVWSLKRLARKVRQTINNKSEKKCDIEFWKAFANQVDYVVSESAFNRNDAKRFSKYFETLYEYNKKWKHDMFYHRDVVYAKIAPAFSRYDILYQNIDSYRCVHSLFDDALIRCIAVVSKGGLVSISFIFDYDCKKDQRIVINDVRDNKQVIELGLTTSKIIFGRANDIPKIFSFIDFNYLLSFKKLVIGDYLTDDNDAIAERLDDKYIKPSNKKNVKDFLNHFSASKAVHLRFAVHDDYYDSKQVMYLYDYISLLSAYNYSFDPYYLWNIVINNTDELEYDDVIKDYIGKPTEHMYIDGNYILISTINPVIPNNLLNKISNKELDLCNSSHQSRFYSFWNYMYACNALAFGGFSLMSSHLLDAIIVNYCKSCYNKVDMVYKYHKFSYLSSSVEMLYNIDYFNIKNEFLSISNPIFESLNINKIEKARKERTTHIWQGANISNSQLYNRYGLIFSLLSLVITVFSYGLVSAIFIDHKAGDQLFDFFEVIFNTGKFRFVAFIACIPFIIWIILNRFSALIYKKTTLIGESNIFKLTDKKKGAIQKRHLIKTENNIDEKNNKK